VAHQRTRRVSRTSRKKARCPLVVHFWRGGARTVCGHLLPVNEHSSLPEKVTCTKCQHWLQSTSPRSLQVKRLSRPDIVDRLLAPAPRAREAVSEAAVLDAAAHIVKVRAVLRRVQRFLRLLEVTENPSEGLALDERTALFSQIRTLLAGTPLEVPPGLGLSVDEHGQGSVPSQPPVGLLVSMALRMDHGLGVPGYYDQPFFKDSSGGAAHLRRFKAAMGTAQQLWEEVTGHGFYQPEKEAEYAARYEEAKALNARKAPP